MPITKKHAFITGSSRGIGRGIALKLAEQGVDIAVHYYQNEAAANETLAEVRKRGTDGFVLQGGKCSPKSAPTSASSTSSWRTPVPKRPHFSNRLWTSRSNSGTPPSLPKAERF
jgi:NAD(P)-dependent dehydrogenase (short-subunit alcohol dehydrogenase family)